jgi:dTDP-4-amino-4,6-dideoxygalactose transaminase
MEAEPSAGATEPPEGAPSAAAAPPAAGTSAPALGGGLELEDGEPDPAWLVPAGQLGTFTILGLEHAQAIAGGGGAILYARARRDGQALRNLAERLVPEELLSDMNAALALAQLKDAERFREKRAELFKVYQQSLLRTRRRTLMSTRDGRPAYYGCVVLLDAAIKDVRAYARKKEVETVLAFEQSCVALGLVPEGSCPAAASLANRAVAFPLHPRLGKTAAGKVAKVLATLP